MLSPFPGMDPYIEHPEVWSDFHGALAEVIRSQLNEAIRPRYVARMTPHMTYETVEIASRRVAYPDVGVWQRQPPTGNVAVATPAIAPAPVVSLVVAELPLRLYTVEIRQVETLKLVTAIEILSPVNKNPAHEAYDSYLRKRQELLRSQVHLMEIDLLRGGTRPPLQTPVPEAPYYVTLSRANQRPYVEVWPIPLYVALPVLPVPLLEPDPDAPLDLDKAVATCYERGGYDMIIDYTHNPPPPKLAQEELLQLDQHLRTQGIR
ncbi:MAG: DUF4058 family protein [Caldilinea sp. CFX5]|nr:DUF4058 family protein [Caldilinea sp. CFX5]